MEMKMLLRIGICVAIIAIGAAGFYYVYWAPTTAHDLSEQATMEAHERDLIELEHATAGIDDLNHKIKEQQEAIKFFESKLPQEKELETVLEQVWKMAEANSLQAKTIRSGKTERNANYSQQEVEMSLAGDFNGFYLFMQQLERLPRLTRVEAMTLSKISDHDGEMQAKLTLSIFFEPTGSGNVSTASAM